MKTTIKYLICRFWHRHKFEPIEAKLDGEPIQIDAKLMGCSLCDLWHWVY